MTATYLGMLATGRTASNSRGVRTYTETHLLESDSRDDDQWIVGSNASLPYIGEVHPSDSLAFCHRLDVKCVEGYKGWQAVAHYTTENSIDGETGIEQDPINDRPKIRWNGTIENRIIHKDRDNEAILNSVGDQLSDTKDDNLFGATVTVNVRQVPSWLLSYRNSTNQSQFILGGLTIPSRVARIVFHDGFISEAMNRNDVTYYQFTYTLLLDEQDFWDGSLIDAGFNYFETDQADNKTKQKIMLGEGTYPSEPVSQIGRAHV